MLFCNLGNGHPRGPCAGGRWLLGPATIAYMAPETLLPELSNQEEDALPGFSQRGPPIDCWALGLTAMELLTGCKLFKVGHRQPSCTLPTDGVSWQMRYTADLHKDWVRAGL
jgi:serine/threonine protein kinase